MTSTAGDTTAGTGGPTGRGTKRTSGPTRDRLLAAARESFAKLGFASTRVADIVALAGTSHGTFYTYFDDKRDALLALTQEAASAIYGAAVAPLADAKRQSPRDAIRDRLTVLMGSRWGESEIRWAKANSRIHPIERMRALLLRPAGAWRREHRTDCQRRSPTMGLTRRISGVQLRLYPWRAVYFRFLLSAGGCVT